jgi:hypothetical protein
MIFAFILELGMVVNTSELKKTLLWLAKRFSGKFLGITKIFLEALTEPILKYLRNCDEENLKSMSVLHTVRIESNLKSKIWWDCSFYDFVIFDDKQADDETVEYIYQATKNWQCRESVPIKYSETFVFLLWFFSSSD